MKKITILSAIIFLYSVANGQIKQKSILIGGQFGYSVENTTANLIAASHNKNTTIVLSVGKAFKENDVYGISLGYLPNTYTNSIYSDGYSPTGDENTIAFSIYHRKYSKVFSALYAFSEIGTGFSYSNRSSSDFGNQVQHLDNAYGGYLYFLPGITYRIHKNIFLELLIPNLARLSYYSSKIKVQNGANTTTNKRNYFGLNTSLSLANFASGIRINL